MPNERSAYEQILNAIESARAELLASKTVREFQEREIKLAQLQADAVRLAVAA